MRHSPDTGGVIGVTMARQRGGFILILTLMVLIVLATITYQVTVKLADRKRADDYLIYYQGARYACDSALKYALATAGIVEPNLADRSDAPDFSDMFGMTDDQVDEMLTAWADELNAAAADEKKKSASDSNDLMSALSSLFPANDPNSAGLLGNTSDMFGSDYVVDANELVVPGPYGPPWPLVLAPIEFEIGTSKVRITIEDENAKLPLVWLTNTDKQLLPVTQEILRVFCGWYGIDQKDVTEFRQSLAKVAEIKPFSPGATAVSAIVPVTQATAPAAAPTPPARTPARGAKNATTAAQPATPAAQQTQAMRGGLRTYSDYSRLMKSTYLNAAWLTTPTIESTTRQEYPMKYLGVWGSTKVNINTAPRQVLEAAFAFGGDGDKIAAALIEQRRIKPFATIDDFRRKNIGYGGQIQKCENYITTQSDVFTIRITATNGPAKCTAIAAVLKQGASVTKINAVFE